MARKGMLGRTRGRPKKTFEKVEREEIWCSRCQTESVISNSNVEDLICGTCLAWEMFHDELDEQGEICDTSEYPRGWHRRKMFAAADGKVYSFGKEVE